MRLPAAFIALLLDSRRPWPLAEKACFIAYAGFEEKIAHLDLDVCPGGPMEAEEGFCRIALEGDAVLVYTSATPRPSPAWRAWTAGSSTTSRAASASATTSPDKESARMELAAARGKGRRAAQGPRRDPRGGGILAGGLVLAALLAPARRFRLFPRRRRGLHARRAAGVPRPARRSAGRACRPIRNPSRRCWPGRRGAPRRDLGPGETGAAGPSGNRYGHPAGRACFAVAGPARAA